MKGMTATLPPELLPAIAAFARVAHHASFTQAAAAMGVSPSALSQTVRTLEQRLGVRLLDRTTRKVGVTEIGRRFLEDAQRGLSALDKAVDALNESRDKPAGLLRLNLSRTAADVVLLPHLADFMNAYPDVQLELHCDNGFVDLVAGGFDAGIRIGEFLAQDVVAVPLSGTMRIATVAAPSYLQGRTPPRTPQDLQHHRCLNVRFPGAGKLYRWEYSHKGRTLEVDVGGALISNDGDVVLSNARAGAGITCAFESTVQADLDAGRLVPLLKPWWPTVSSFHIYYPSRLHMPRKLRVLIDFVQARMQSAASANRR